MAAPGPSPTIESYANGVTIAAGALLVDGSLGGSAVAVNNGGTLGGHGAVGAVNVASGGTLSPGASSGTLSTGNLSFVAGAHFNVEIGGVAAGLYDRVHVTGTVDLGGATLDASLINGFDPHAAARTASRSSTTTSATSSTVPSHAWPRVRSLTSTAAHSRSAITAVTATTWS